MNNPRCFKIAVVADDFTGAAEVAAIGYRVGVATRILLALPSDGCSEFTVLDTDSRSEPPERSREKITEACRFLRANHVRYVYKKTDSALRGQIRTEVEELAKGLGKTRVLLAPANPSLDRRIERGILTIGEHPIDQTPIADDPEFPALSADVIELLSRSPGGPVAYRSMNETLPRSGTVIVETRSVADLEHWAGKVDENTLPAGGAEFFRAVLARLHSPQGLECSARIESILNGTRLFVAGSALANRKSVLDRLRANGIEVIAMPPELMHADGDSANLDRWVNAVSDAYSSHKTVCAASLGWTSLEVIHEWSLGVVSLQVIDSRAPIVTVKPGSYDWPDVILNSKNE